MMLRCSIIETDPMKNITDTIDRALRSAGLDPDAGPVGDASQVIQRALKAAGLSGLGANARAGTAAPLAKAPLGGVSRAPWRNVGRAAGPASDDPRFTTHTHAEGAASRSYKLYVPASYTRAPMPLFVMLHGCQQHPDDFAAGTRMNVLAEQHGFLVAYPAQSAGANGNNCWNWFQAAEQRRGGVETSLIAGIVGAVARDCKVDDARVYVAGLSAGAAMAVILGNAYPDVFAGVAAHSGLPLGAAHDVPSAFAAMQGRAAAPAARRGHTAGSGPSAPVRTIVFHGDADATVVPANAHAIVQGALAAYPDADVALTTQLEGGVAPGGRAWSATRYVDAAGRPHVESWLVHGAPHAWSGGSASGSYTDASGPDASAQIVRFFLGS
jgi:poly(hydroxyalkanoate) depolymerase family esterase